MSVGPTYHISGQVEKRYGAELVCYYQVIPMHDTVHYISQSPGNAGIFPFGD